MRIAEPVELGLSVGYTGWRAELDLEFERRGPRSVLAARRHDGPLVVQKALHPEGDAVCHAIIVHPPAGIAGGDDLRIGARLGGGAHALLTTPGAGKWYRSAGAFARQRIGFALDADAVLEWLPQETIVFDGALADAALEVTLAPGARYLGWEILCLGRTGSGERLTRGEYRGQTRVSRRGMPLFHERGRIEGGGRLLESPAGLAGQPVCATLLAVSDACGAELVGACREIRPESGEGAVTRLPGVLVARYLGASSEAAKQWMIALWRVLRPALLGREAVEPRIWRT